MNIPDGDHRLPEKWAHWLAGQPETGMGYQVVDVTLSDGSIIRDVAVVQSELIAEVRGHESIPFDPTLVIDMRLTHNRWQFRR
jgi:hypothetical protein